MSAYPRFFMRLPQLAQLAQLVLLSLALLVLAPGCARRSHQAPTLGKPQAGRSFNSDNLVRGFLGQDMSSPGRARTAGAGGPDADNDGVADSRDECPSTPRGAAVDAFGCPVPLYLQLRVTHGDAAPLNVAPFTGQLRRLARLMRENPDSLLFIEGHAHEPDSVPKSFSFANKVKERLVQEFKVPEARIQVSGAGERKPLVSNASPEGRQRNQRLELTLKGRYQSRKTPPRINARQTALPTVAKASLPSESRLRPGKPEPMVSSAPVHLRFGYGGASLLPADEGRLAEIAETLRNNPGVRVRIVGHTDSDSSAAYNLGLSRRRANGVKERLHRVYNIAPERITAIGRGESEPIAGNATKEGRAANRRVTITLEPGAQAPPTGADVSKAPPVEKRKEMAQPRPLLERGVNYSIKVSLGSCKLWLYRDGQLVRTYTVATPGPGMPRPHGLGRVTKIEFDPWWVPTKNIRKRALRKGQRLPSAIRPGSPANPMGRFKLHLSHGQGFRIHGTNQPSLIGRRVSSGCIRMRNDQGLELAQAISVGTPVTFVR